MLGGFPTDLLAKSGGVARRLDRAEVLEEIKQDGFEEVPVLRANGEQRAQPQLRPLDFIDVKDRQVPLAAGGNVKAQTMLRAAS